MHSEREELVKYVFPELRKRCRGRGVELTEVDLRWGVTDEQVAEGKVLPICLAEIERCQPYFIGLLGERYGYMPREVDRELLAANPWLEKHKETSITELEIRHGVLESPEMQNLTFFYFRDPKRSHEVEQDLDRRSSYLSEPDSAPAKLNALKEMIRSQQHRFAAPVRENYPDSKALGKLILEDLWRVIDERYPEEEIPSTLEKERLEHEAFARFRRKVYIEREVYLERLDEHAVGVGPPLVILGESGSGKSALIANWVEKYRQKLPDQLMIIHFVGSTPDSTDYVRILCRIMEEIKVHCQFQDREEVAGLSDNDADVIPSDPQKIVEVFPSWLNRAAVQGKVILVLDAINQLEDQDNSHDLGWLPEHLPANIRLILSTLSGRSCEILINRNLPTLTIEPMKMEERRQFIESYLAQYRKNLSRLHIEKIAAAALSSNPLYLRTLLEELRVFGIHEELDQKIKHYLSANTVEGLFKLVLQRLESDYEKEITAKGLVKDTMSLLWASRKGLSETELLGILGSIKKPMPRSVWSPLYLALEESLVNIGGLLNFFHDYLRKAVETKYLDKPVLKQAAHGRLADYFAKIEGRFRHFIDDRIVDELPWQLAKAENWARLKECLTDMNMFIALSEESKLYELVGYWKAIENKFDLVEVYKNMLAEFEQTSPTEKKYTSMLNAVAIFYEEKFHYAEAETLYRRALEIRERQLGSEHPDLALYLNNLAELYVAQRRLTEAEPLYLQALEMRETIFGKDSYDVVWYLNNLAKLYMHQGRYDEVESLYRRALDICEKVLGKEHPEVALLINNLAGLYDARGLYTEAETLYRGALEIEEKVKGRFHPHVATTLNNLAALYYAQGRFDEAEFHHNQALAIREKALGKDHPEVASSLNGLAALHRARHNFIKAEHLYQRALAIRTKVLGDNHPDVAMSLNNLADLYYAQGRHAEAEPLYRRALPVCERAFGRDHPYFGIILNNLATLYHAWGRHDEAEPLLQLALKTNEKSLGLNHSNVAAVLNNLAGVYEAQGRYEEAEPLYIRALAIRKESFGRVHPDVATSLNNLAELYNKQGQHGEAELLHKQALLIKETIFGKEHPYVTISLSNLAATYEDQGRHAEAELLVKRILDIEKKMK